MSNDLFSGATRDRLRRKSSREARFTYEAADPFTDPAADDRARRAADLAAMGGGSAYVAATTDFARNGFAPEPMRSALLSDAESLAEAVEFGPLDDGVEPFKRMKRAYDDAMGPSGATPEHPDPIATAHLPYADAKQVVEDKKRQRKANAHGPAVSLNEAIDSKTRRSSLFGYPAIEPIDEKSAIKTDLRGKVETVKATVEPAAETAPDHRRPTAKRLSEIDADWSAWAEAVGGEDKIPPVERALYEGVRRAAQEADDSATGRREDRSFEVAQAEQDDGAVVEPTAQLEPDKSEASRTPKEPRQEERRFPAGVGPNAAFSSPGAVLEEWLGLDHFVSSDEIVSLMEADDDGDDDPLDETAPPELKSARYFEGATKRDLIFAAAIEKVARGRGAGLWKAIWGEAADASAFVTLARNPFYRDEMRRVALAYGHSEPSIDLAFALAKAKEGDADTRAALREMRKDLGAWLGDPANGAHPDHYSLETFASSIDQALEDDNWDWAIGAVLHQDSQAQQLLDPTFSALGGLATGAVGGALRWRSKILRRDRARANGGDDWTRADYMAAGRLLGGKKYPKRLQRQLQAYMEKQGFKVHFNDQKVAELAAQAAKNGVKGGAAAFSPGKKAFYFPKIPTYYQIWHELAHYVHYRKVGREMYMEKYLTTVEKEQFVYDMLRSTRRWHMKDEKGGGYINSHQKADAIRYIESLGGRSDQKR